jgi:hypothetical protein
MVSTGEERRKQDAWEALCRETGWVCHICGGFPEIGKQLANGLCDDCQLTLKNADSSNPP